MRQGLRKHAHKSPPLEAVWRKNRVAKSVLSISYEPLAVETNRTSVQGEIRFSVQNFHSCPPQNIQQTKPLMGWLFNASPGIRYGWPHPQDSTITPQITRALGLRIKWTSEVGDDPPHLSLKLYNKQTAAIQAVLFHNLQPKKKQRNSFLQQSLLLTFFGCIPNPKLPNQDAKCFACFFCHQIWVSIHLFGLVLIIVKNASWSMIALDQRRLSKLECKTRPCYFWLPRMTKVLLMDCNSHSVWTTGGSCGKVGHVDAMGSAQISQGQSTYHVHPNGLLDKLVMQQIGGGEWGSGCLLEEMHKWEDIMNNNMPTCNPSTPRSLAPEATR